MKSQRRLPISICTVKLRSVGSLFLTDAPLKRDELHPEIAQTLLDWAGSTKSGDQLIVHVAAPDSSKTVTEEKVANLVRTHFLRMADHQTRRISDVFRYARAATLIGLLAVIVLLSSVQAIPEGRSQVMAGLRESITIFAWVAMWKPAELWLYEHWPLRHWRRAALRLAEARVKLLQPIADEDDRYAQTCP